MTPVRKHSEDSNDSSHQWALTGFHHNITSFSCPLSHVIPRSVPHRPHRSPPYRHFARAKNLLNTICFLHHCSNPIYAVLLNEKENALCKHNENVLIRCI